MTAETFEWYIRQQLAPHLRPGQIVVLDNLLDNLSAHKAANICEALTARQCELLFLLPFAGI